MTTTDRHRSPRGRLVMIGCYLLTACGHHSPDGTTPDASGEEQDSGAPDASDTCQPTGVFGFEMIPGADSYAGSGADYRASVMRLTNGAPEVLGVIHTPDSGFPIQTGGVVAWTRSAPMTWASSGFDASTPPIPAPDVIAVTEDGASCIAYMHYDGQLHLACKGMLDRTLAPRMDSGISIAHIGASLALVYYGSQGLVYQTFDGNVGPVEVIDVEGNANHGLTALAIDALGEPHVVYDAFPRDTSHTATARLIYHAYRRNGTWTRELVDTQSPDSNWGYLSSKAFSIVMDGDQPAIAYNDFPTRSVRLARRTAAGTFEARTLIAPDPGFQYDFAGESVVLQRDCVGRLLIAYQRKISTDLPNIGIAVARVTDGGLADEQLLPWRTGETPPSYGDGLSFQIDANGHQYVAAHVFSSFSSSVYFAYR